MSTLTIPTNPQLARKVGHVADVLYELGHMPALDSVTISHREGRVLIGLSDRSPDGVVQLGYWARTYSTPVRIERSGLISTVVQFGHYQADLQHNVTVAVAGEILARLGVASTACTAHVSGDAFHQACLFTLGVTQ